MTARQIRSPGPKFVLDVHGSTEFDRIYELLNYHSFYQGFFLSAKDDFDQSCSIF